MISSLMFMFLACGDKEEDTSVEAEEVEETAEEVEEEDTASEESEEGSGAGEGENPEETSSEE